MSQLPQAMEFLILLMLCKKKSPFWGIAYDNKEVFH